MRKITIFLFCISAVCLLYACKKQDIPLFNAGPSLYFSSASPVTTGNQTNTAVVAFGYSADNVTDSIVKIPINVLGKTLPIDRAYKVIVVDSGTTAKAGINYDLPQTTVIRANLSVDSLVVTVHRTPDILYNQLTLMLQLEPNDNFSLNMKNDTLDALTGQPVYFTIFNVTMVDGLTIPGIWNYGGGPKYFFGTFSAKKLRLINTVTGMPLSALSSYTYYSEWTYWATFTNRYLLDQAAAGAPVLEDDGTPMIMGVNVTR